MAVASLGVFTPHNLLSFYIGARPGGSERFVGQIDEVGMFSRGLSADDINVLFAAGHAGQVQAHARGRCGARSKRDAQVSGTS